METDTQDDESSPEAVEAPEAEVTKAPECAVAEIAPEVLRAPVVQTIRTSLFNAPFAPPGK